MSWVAGVHFYLYFASAADAAIAKQELENFIYQEKHLERFLRVELLEGNTVTIQEVDNEIFDMEGIAMEIQNFCKQKFQQNLQGAGRKKTAMAATISTKCLMEKSNLKMETGCWIIRSKSSDNSGRLPRSLRKRLK